MKKIAIVGKGDKRIFTYPLLNVCKKAAKTCVITDDVTYRRLYKGYDVTDEIEDIEINIIKPSTGTPDADMQARIDKIIDIKTEEDFDLIIFILDGFLPEGMDKTLAVLSQHKTFLGWDLEEFTDKNPDVEYALMSMYYTEKSKYVKIHKIDWKMSHFMYMCRVEEFKKLIPLKDKAINKYISRLFAEQLNLTEETFDKIANAPA